MWQNYSKDTSNISMIFLNDVLSDNIDYKASNRDENVLSEFLSENWFNISFDLIYEGDSFVSMSQGKQAFVILKLLLEFSDKTCPILIDQPEDDISMKRIENYMIDYFNSVRDKKQVIFVTHNPLLVVNLDVDNVINITKDRKNILSVKSGCLEDKDLLEIVSESLDGGKEAVERRLKVYGTNRNRNS